MCYRILTGCLVVALAGLWTESSTGETFGTTGMRDQAAAGEAVRWRIDDFARDDGGQVWGIGSREDFADPSDGIVSVRRLVVFDVATLAWKEHPWTGLKDGMVPNVLVRLASGAVGCYWQNGDRGAVTVHREDRSHVLGWLKELVLEPRLLALSDGGLAITGRSPKAIRLAGPAPAQAAVLRLRDEWLSPPFKEQPGSQRDYAGVSAMERQDGSLVLWNYSAEAHSGWWRLSGLLTWTTGEAPRLTKIALASEAPVTAVVAGSEGALVVAAAGRGLMQLVLPTGFWSEVITPDPAREYIESVFSSGGSNFILTTVRPATFSVEAASVLQGHLSMQRTIHHDTSHRVGSLLRHDLSGHAMVEVVKGLDWEPRPGAFERPVLPFSTGMLLGSRDSGPWWIPSAKGARPWRLEREDGFTLGSALGLVEVGKLGFLARQEAGYWQFLPWPADEPARAETRMGEVLTGGYLVTDSKWGLWGFSTSFGSVIHWNGQKWAVTAAPGEIGNLRKLEYAGDGNDQGWLLPWDAGRTAVLDFNTGDWHWFDSLEDAVTARLKAGDQVPLRRHPSFGLWSHPGGARGFLDWSGTVHVWAGEAWRRFSLTEIGGEGARVTGVPFFDGRGVFCVSLNHQSYQYGADGVWSGISRPDGFVESNKPGEPADAPAGFPHLGVQSTCYDRHGVAWVAMRDGALWKWLDRVAVQVKDHGQGLILPPRTQVREVLTDAGGTAFLRHDGAGEPMRYLGIQPGRMRSATMVSARLEALDSVRLEVPADFSGWWRWREVGKQEWSRLSQNNSVLLTGLSPGCIKWEVQCLNEELSAEGSSIVVEAELKPAGNEDLEHVISQLSVTEGSARETAARILRGQGEAAVPALKKALAASVDDESLTWWIRAVLQHIERNSGRK